MNSVMLGAVPDCEGVDRSLFHGWSRLFFFRVSVGLGKLNTKVRPPGFAMLLSYQFV